jgi:hypothetical protein
MNLDIDEEMIASGETQQTDRIRLRLLPIPRTQHSETISGNHSLVIISATTPPAPPFSWWTQIVLLFDFFDFDAVTSRTCLVVREFATSKSISPPFLGWVRSFVDADFADEEWGDSYMMPVEGQPKYYHCVDILLPPQGESDWDIIWRAMNDEGENVENGKRKKDNETNQRINEESFCATLRSRGLPDTLISEPMKKQDDEEFQGFVAAGAEVSISPTESGGNGCTGDARGGIIWLRGQYELAHG